MSAGGDDEVCLPASLAIQWLYSPRIKERSDRRGNISTQNLNYCPPRRQKPSSLSRHSPPPHPLAVELPLPLPLAHSLPSLALLAPFVGGPSIAIRHTIPHVAILDIDHQPCLSLAVLPSIGSTSCHARLATHSPSHIVRYEVNEISFDLWNCTFNSNFYLIL